MGLIKPPTRTCDQESSVPGQHPANPRTWPWPISFVPGCRPIITRVTWPKCFAFAFTLTLDKESIWDRLLATQLVVAFSVGRSHVTKNRQRNNSSFLQKTSGMLSMNCFPGISPGCLTARPCIRTVRGPYCTAARFRCQNRTLETFLGTINGLRPSSS